MSYEFELMSYVPYPHGLICYHNGLIYR